MNPTFAAANKDDINAIEEDRTSVIPSGFTLKQNYPNPFNPVTTIEFTITESDSRVSLKIYNLLGEHVATLVEAHLQAGQHCYQWQAENIASGVYFYVLVLDGLVAETRKMIMMR